MSRCGWRGGLGLGAALLLAGCASQPFGKPVQYPDGLRVMRSADGKMEARVFQVSKDNSKNFESRVELYLGKELVNSADYSSPDGRHGRIILKIGWTGDSQFFVYSTMSSSGEMTWRMDTFFYSRKHDKFFHLDDQVGTIVESEFILQSSDTLLTRRLKPGDKLEESEPVTVRLGTLVPR